MPQVNPEIIVWARETSGLTQEEAALKLGFRDSSVSSAVDKLVALEEGDKEPTRPQLVKMAEQYRRPLLIFYLSKPPAKGDRGADFRTLSDERSSRDDALLDTLVRDIRARQSMVRALLEDEEDTAPLAFVGSHVMEDGRAAVLESLNNLLDVELMTYRAKPDTSSAFDLLRGSAERAGIFVLIKGDVGNYLTAIDLSIFRGFSIADDVAPFVAINDQDARSAWSFTLLHETVHLLLGQTALSGEYGEDEVEQFCDGVAGEFLLPPEELGCLTFDGDNDLNEVSGRISDFANKRKLSRTMVAYNAYRSRQISWEAFGQLRTEYRQQWRTERERSRSQAREREGGPNFYTVRRHRLGKRITDLVQRMMADDTLSTSKAARILGVKSRQVQPLLEARSSP
jgi:Zn-dependent peptidase ImmA (M78 family)/transcriptional regulator with XRE-family HTH domain